MSTLTTNYSLVKPGGSDNVDFVTLIGGNMDAIDTQMKTNSDDALASKNKFQQTTSVTLELNKTTASTIQASIDAVAKIIEYGQTLVIDITESVVMSSVLTLRNFSGNGSLTLSAESVNVSSIDTGTETITLASNPFAVDDIVMFNAATLPAGLDNYTPYYVIYSSGNDIRVSTTLGGAAVNITTTGTTVKCYMTLTRTSVAGQVLDYNLNTIKSFNLLNIGIISDVAGASVVHIDNNDGLVVLNNALIAQIDTVDNASCGVLVQYSHMEGRNGSLVSQGRNGTIAGELGRVHWAADYDARCSATYHLKATAGGFITSDTQASSPTSDILTTAGGLVLAGGYMYANGLYQQLTAGAATWA